VIDLRCLAMNVRGLWFGISVSEWVRLQQGSSSRLLDGNILYRLIKRRGSYAGLTTKGSAQPPRTFSAASGQASKL
jgi:hypothetical protein